MFSMILVVAVTTGGQSADSNIRGVNYNPNRGIGAPAGAFTIYGDCRGGIVPKGGTWVNQVPPGNIIEAPAPAPAPVNPPVAPNPPRPANPPVAVNPPRAPNAPFTIYGDCRGGIVPKGGTWVNKVPPGNIIEGPGGQVSTNPPRYNTGANPGRVNVQRVNVPANPGRVNVPVNPARVNVPVNPSRVNVPVNPARVNIGSNPPASGGPRRSSAPVSYRTSVPAVIYYPSRSYPTPTYTTYSNTVSTPVIRYAPSPVVVNYGYYR